MGMFKQPTVPAKFLRYELQTKSGTTVACHKTKAKLRRIMRALRQRFGTPTEIFKVTTRGIDFVEC